MTTPAVEEAEVGRLPGIQINLTIPALPLVSLTHINVSIKQTEPEKKKIILGKLTQTLKDKY